MIKENKNKIKRLDKTLKSLKEIDVPDNGWINSIRKNLQMTYSQLATRAKTKPQVIKIFENNEEKGTITINTLKKIAEAMDCKLVYAITPRKSFKKIINERAEKIAVKILNEELHTGPAEEQAPGENETRRKIKELKYILKNNFSKKFWDYEI